MSKTTFDSEELIKIIKKINTRIDKLQCFIIECCSKIPINIGDGFGLYKKLSGNHWQFKSLKEGDNITITEDAETLTITSSGGGSSFTCTDLNSCSTTNLPEGANLYYTNPRAVSALTGQNISIFTNDSGYITSFALSPYLLSSTASSTYEPIITPGTTLQYWRGDKTWQTFPTIPAAQIQSDWNQTDNLLLDYIKNKPSIPAAQVNSDWNSVIGVSEILNKPIIPSVTPSALTTVDDTNVTITLGGTPLTSLLQATSLTLGWSGTLADSRITSATKWNTRTYTISIDGQGAVILTGSAGFGIVPFTGTITSFKIINGEGLSTGNIVIDLKIGGVSIIGAGNKPTLAGVSSATANVSGWTSANVIVNSLLEANVDSATIITKCQLVLIYTV